MKQEKKETVLSKTKYKFYVDCNEWQPMIFGANVLLRGYYGDEQENNGVSPIMMVSLDQVNDSDFLGTLTSKDAFFLAGSPDVYNALIDILNNGLNHLTYVQAMKAIELTKDQYNESNTNL